MKLHSLVSRRAALLLAAGVALAPAAWADGPAPRVKFKTSLGEFVVELAPDKAPKTVANFLQYVKDRHYDGTVFHRVINGFMIQGGGFTPDLHEKPTRAPVPLEADNGLKNDRGTIAMARTTDPDSATAQFFINLKNNDMLNAPRPDGYGYTVFGKVVGGMDVVDRIRAVPVADRGPYEKVPVTPVVIESATLATPADQRKGKPAP